MLLKPWINLPIFNWNWLVQWETINYKRIMNLWAKCEFQYRMILVCLCTVLLNAHHIYFFIGAASISLHRCSLTIQEEAPPPQWLNPISCIWLGHWCRTKLWHCTSQSKLCYLLLLSWTHLLINVQTWFVSLMITAKGSPLTPMSVINKSEWHSVLCCYDLQCGLWWIVFVIVFKEVTRDHRDKQREDKQGCDRESCE